LAGEGTRSGVDVGDGYIFYKVFFIRRNYACCLLLVACCLVLGAWWVIFLKILKLFEYTKIIKTVQNHKFILPFFSQNTHTFTIKNPHYRIYDHNNEIYQLI